MRKMSKIFLLCSMLTLLARGSRYEYNVPGPAERQEIRISPSELVIRTGERLYATCDWRGPEDQISWIMKHPTGQESEVATGSRLMIENVESPGEFTYLCRVRNPDGSYSESPLRVSVSAPELPEQRPPSVWIIPAIQQVGIGQRAQMAAHSDIDADFVWYKAKDDGEKVPIARGSQLSVEIRSDEDLGRYVCVARAIPSGLLTEQTAQLQLLPPQIQRSPDDVELTPCETHEATCGDGTCIERGLICDGKQDCPDGTDERGCGGPGTNEDDCHPDQFRCVQSGQCIQKIWLCDGEKDCDDGSDELSEHCQSVPPYISSSCKISEFQCASPNMTQCIPRSYVCDETIDCLDHSDELGCVKPKVISAPQREKVVSEGETLVLHCSARGTPTPFINWRLNWGHVCRDGSDRCTISHEINRREPDLVTGTLRVRNVVKADSGAYSCEAINTKGFDFAIPDAFVRVLVSTGAAPLSPKCDSVGTLRDLGNKCVCKLNVYGPYCSECKPGYYFRSNQNAHGCISCFCSGVSKDCTSDDSKREMKLIELTNPGRIWYVVHQNYPQNPWTGTPRIDFERGSITFDSANAPPGDLYWSPPPSPQNPPLGNMIKAYGGNVRIKISSSPNGDDVKNVFLWIRGNKIDLVHRCASLKSAESFDGTVEYVIGLSERSFSRLDGSPVDRPHMLMALADVEKFWIRASSSQTPTTLESVVFEVASDRGNGLIASEVEKCSCPAQYTGSSCEICANGYTRRHGVGLYLGECYSCREHCNGMTDQCDPHTGKCLNCEGNSFGERCEQCLPSHQKDHSGKCELSRLTAIPPVKIDGNPIGLTNLHTLITIVIRPGRQKLIRIESDELTRLPLTVWLRVTQSGGTERLPSGMRQIGTDLMIENATPEMAGVYQVTLYLKDGRIMRPKIILRYDEEPTTTPFLEPSGPTIRKAINDHLTISVNTNNLPVRGIMWLKDGSTLPQSVIVEPQRIVIDKLSPDLCGIYEAHVYYNEPQPIILKTTIECVYERTFPQDDGQGGAPQISLSPSDLNLIEGQSMVVTYQLIGDQPLNLNWQQWKESRWVEMPASFIVYNDRLVLNKSRLSDSGIYRVQASNRIGVGQATLRLNVEPRIFEPSPVSRPPSVRFPNTIYEIPVNHHANIVPEIQINAPYTVFWTKSDGSPLPSGIEVRGDGISINSMKPEFSGSYTIEVITDDAQTKVPVDVDAIEPFGGATGLLLNIDGPGMSTVSLGNDVSLKCEAKGEYSGGVVISWSMQGRPQLPSNTVGSGGNLFISDFGVQNSGFYQCSAVTGDHQHAESSVELRLSAVPGGNQRISLSWLPSAIVDVVENDSLEAQCIGSPDSKAVRVTTINGQGSVVESPWLESVDGRVRIGSVTGEMNGIRLVCQVPALDPAQAAELTINVNPEFEDSARAEQQNSGRLEVTLPTKLDVEAGSGFELKCQVHGVSESEVKITWTKHGRTGVEDLPPHLKGSNDGVLRGSNVRPDDYAYYMCTVERLSTGEQAVAYVLLDVQNAKVRPSVRVYPSENVQLGFGASTSLVCYAYDGEPSPTVSWRRSDGRDLGPNIQLRNTQLDIQSATQQDSGQYECVAENSAGQSKAFVKVEVQSPQKIDLVVNPEEIGDVNDESPRYAQCIAVGSPVPKVRWMHENQNLTKEEDGYSLVLIKPTTLRAGLNTFTCVANNQFVRTSKDVHVNVQRQTPFVPYSLPVETKALLRINPAIASEDDRVQLRCSISGSVSESPLSLTWVKDGGQIVETKLTFEGSADIELADVSTSDSGDYKCEVYRDSELIAESNSERLNVRRRQSSDDKSPRIVAVANSVVAQQGGKAKLRCRVVNRVRSKIVWIRIGKDLPVRSVIRKATLRIDNVQKDDEGHYKCVAFNEFGSSEDLISLEIRHENGRTSVELESVPSRETSYGQKSSLQCRTSDSGASIVWQKDGRRSFRSGVSIDGDRLYFYPQQPDTGVYSCYAVRDGNVLGTASMELRIKDSRLGTLEYFPAQSPALDVQERAAAADQQPKTKRPILISIRPLQGVYQVDGHVSFECDTSVNGAQIHWERQRPSESFSPFAKIDANRIMFEKFTSDDVGEYKCVVETGDLKGEKYLHLDIDVVNNDVIFAYPDHPLVISHGSPNINVTFLNPPSEFKKNGMVEVECAVAGQRDAPIVWSREDSKTLADNVRIDKGILKIERFNEQNLGEYKCSAQTYVGDLSRVIVFEPESFPGILVNQSDQKPRIEFQFLSSRQDFRAGGHVIVECISNDKTARVGWTRLNGPLSSNVKLDNQFLSINPFSFEDIGVYECSAHGQMGSAVRSIQFDENDLSSNILPNNQEVLPSPRLQFNPLNKYEIDGKVEIRCVVDNDPTAKVQWHRGERKTFGYRTESRGELLRFNEYISSDSGIYSCIASNQYGTKYISVEISVDDRGTVRVTNERVNQIPVQRTRNPLVVEFLSPLSQFRQGGDITVICYFSGNVPGVISWRKIDERTNQTLEMSSKVVVEGSRLHFPQFSSDQLGSYECQGTSENGIAHKIVSLNSDAFTLVESPPIEEQRDDEPLRITVDGTRSGEKVKFNCKPARGGGRIAVKWQSKRSSKFPPGARQIGTRLIFDQFYGPLHHDVYTCKARLNGQRFSKSIDTRDVISDRSEVLGRRRLHLRNPELMEQNFETSCTRGRNC